MSDYYEKMVRQNVLLGKERDNWRRAAEAARAALEREEKESSNLKAWLKDICELGADSMSVGLAANALNGIQHDETKRTET